MDNVPSDYLDKLKISELSESIRKILEDRREAKAVEQAKPKLFDYLRLVGMIGRTDRVRFRTILSLMVETHAATKKKDIHNILEKARELDTEI